MSFVWKADEKWSYESNETNVEFNMGVPMPDGTMCQIEHLCVDTTKETLGVFTCPSGSFGTHLSSMKKKGQEGIDRAKESHITRRDICICKTISDTSRTTLNVWNPGVHLSA